MDESCLWEHLVKQSSYDSVWFGGLVWYGKGALESFYHMIVQLKPHESHHEGMFIAQQLFNTVFPQIELIALQMEFYQNIEFCQILF